MSRAKREVIGWVEKDGTLTLFSQFPPRTPLYFPGAGDDDKPGDDVGDRSGLVWAWVWFVVAIMVGICGALVLGHWFAPVFECAGGMCHEVEPDVFVR